MLGQINNFNSYLTTVKNNIESCIGNHTSLGPKTLGIVLAYCEYMSEKDMKKLEKYMAENQHNVLGKALFDYNGRILCVLLENQSLNYTHYYSLVFSDYLTAANKLAGNIVVSDSAISQLQDEDTISEMIEMTKSIYENSSEIIIYSSECKKKAGVIVIVDPSKENGLLLKNFFEIRGFVVFTAKNAAEAKRLIKECMPDIIITGLYFEGFNGYEILECATANKNFKKKSKVVILTNSKNEMDIKRSFELGASDYLTKPYSLVELEVRIKRLIEKI